MSKVKVYTNAEIIYLKENYSWLDKETILRETGRSWPSIKHKAKKLGLSRPNIRKAKLKKLIDNSIHNAYWWGFIMSDGYLSDRGDLVVCLSTIDKTHLLSLSNYIGYNVNILDTGDNMSRWSVMDKINCSFLRDKLQITEKKTYNPPLDHSFLSTPEERLAFFIGFVDGDGSITYKNGSFKSIRIVIHGNWCDWWSDFTTQLTLDYPEFKFNVNNTNARGNTSVYIGTKKTKETLDNFIKENKLTTLERKWKLLN